MLRSHTLQMGDFLGSGFAGECSRSDEEYPMGEFPSGRLDSLDPLW